MATAKKNLYLLSEVDLPTGEKAEQPGDPKPTRRVGPGVLSELDISDEEVASLPRGVVRAATADEIEAAEQRAAAAEKKTKPAAKAADDKKPSDPPPAK